MVVARHLCALACHVLEPLPQRQPAAQAIERKLQALHTHPRCLRSRLGRHELLLLAGILGGRETLRRRERRRWWRVRAHVLVGTSRLHGGTVDARPGEALALAALRAARHDDASRLARPGYSTRGRAHRVADDEHVPDSGGGSAEGTHHRAEVRCCGEARLRLPRGVAVVEPEAEALDVAQQHEVLRAAACRCMHTSVCVYVPVVRVRACVRAGGREGGHAGVCHAYRGKKGSTCGRATSATVQPPTTCACGAVR